MPTTAPGARRTSFAASWRSSFGSGEREESADLVVDSADERIQIVCRPHRQVIGASAPIDEAWDAPFSLRNQAAYDHLEGGDPDV
jgi:hypothetical protein